MKSAAYVDGKPACRICGKPASYLETVNLKGGRVVHKQCIVAKRTRRS